MTLIRFLLEYTIEHVCCGNRSECARRLGLEYDELRRYHKRIHDGGTSTRITESLLEMYWRERLSIDEVLQSYTDSRFGSDLEEAERVCDELIRSIRELLDAEKQEKQEHVQLLRAASSFFSELEHSFCKRRCRRCDYEERACPASQFSSYLQMLQGELKSEQNKNEEAV